MHARVRAGFRRTLGSLAAIALLVPLTAGENHHAGRAFPQIFAFGDSLTDMGNFHRLTGMLPFPYWEGRASDGPVWIEYLAAKLGVSIEDIHNYAWFGALSGNTNFRSMPGLDLPGLEQQIAQFLQDVGEEGADPDALYTVWVGPNDFLDLLVNGGRTPESMVATGVGNTVQGIVALANAGARHFVVGNMPDLGLAPFFHAMGPELAGTVSYLSATYSFMLEEQLSALEVGLGINITRLDAFGILNQMAAEPVLFGMTNVTDSAIASDPASDPSEYLFWDEVHPSTATNEWIADFVCAAMVETYAPRKARGKGPRNHHALNGLVRAAKCRK